MAATQECVCQIGRKRDGYRWPLDARTLPNECTRVANGTRKRGRVYQRRQREGSVIAERDSALCPEQRHADTASATTAGWFRVRQREKEGALSSLRRIVRRRRTEFRMTSRRAITRHSYAAGHCYAICHARGSPGTGNASCAFAAFPRDRRCSRSCPAKGR